MLFISALVLTGVALNFVFKYSRSVREEGYTTVATMLSVSSIGFAVALLIITYPFLAWASQP